MTPWVNDQTNPEGGTYFPMPLKKRERHPDGVLRDIKIKYNA